jgi:hypothetical protein
MASFTHDDCKTDIEETQIKYIVSQAMLMCNCDSYVDFLIQKLQFVKVNDDPRFRLEMIQDDKWLSTGFDRFHADSSSSPTTVMVPLYICKPNKFKRVLCGTCEQYFCCSRNFKGKRFVCSKCENNNSYSKRQKLNSTSSTVGMDNSSTGSNGINGSAIRAARDIDAASWRKENCSNNVSENPQASTSSSDEDSD